LRLQPNLRQLFGKNIHPFDTVLWPKLFFLMRALGRNKKPTRYDDL
jgi:hypothetical protein